MTTSGREQASDGTEVHVGSTHDTEDEMAACQVCQHHAECLSQRGGTFCDCRGIVHPIDRGREQESHPVVPDERGCFGWPRTCGHHDDLDCFQAESQGREQCPECGSTERVQKFRDVICGGCRVVLSPGREQR